MYRLLLLLLLAPLACRAQEREYRVIVDTNVPCHVAPDPNARVFGRFPFPAYTWVEETTSGEAGSTGWILVRNFNPEMTCWVDERLTVQYHRGRPEEVLLAIVDHFIATADGRPLEDFVRVDNLFAQRWGVTGHQETDVESSPVLGLRRLQLLEKAVRSELDFRIQEDPFKLAWILSHGSTLRGGEPAIHYWVEPGAFWELFERFRETPIAEEIAWAAAQQLGASDCEGSGDCYLGLINVSLSRYWVEFPQGTHIAEAIELGRRYAEITSRCQEQEWPVLSTKEGIESIRRTLQEVHGTDKAPLLEVLAQAEANCLVRSR